MNVKEFDKALEELKKFTNFSNSNNLAKKIKDESKVIIKMTEDLKKFEEENIKLIDDYKDVFSKHYELGYRKALFDFYVDLYQRTAKVIKGC